MELSERIRNYLIENWDSANTGDLSPAISSYKEEPGAARKLKTSSITLSLWHEEVNVEVADLTGDWYQATILMAVMLTAGSKEDIKLMTQEVMRLIRSYPHINYLATGFLIRQLNEMKTAYAGDIKFEARFLGRIEDLWDLEIETVPTKTI